MKDYMIERCRQVAMFIIKNNATVRKAAEYFGISKTTVHIDITKRLPNINKKLAKQANEVLQRNKRECCMRGGLATKAKYRNFK